MALQTAFARIFRELEQARIFPGTRVERAVIATVFVKGPADCILTAPALFIVLIMDPVLHYALRRNEEQTHCHMAVDRWPLAVGRSPFAVDRRPATSDQRLPTRDQRPATSDRRPATMIG